MSLVPMPVPVQCFTSVSKKSTSSLPSSMLPAAMWKCSDLLWSYVFVVPSSTNKSMGTNCGLRLYPLPVNSLFNFGLNERIA